MTPRTLGALASIACLMAVGVAGAQAASNPNVNAEAADAAPPEFHSVLIGDFFYRDVRPVEGVKIRLSFTLHMSVEPEQREQVAELLGRKLHRVRSAVLTAVRLCRVRNYQEPDLHTLRLRIAAQVRRMAPGLPLGDLLISEFAYFTD